MAELAKPRLVGFNHVALEVGDIEEALAFYGRLFTFELRGKSDSMAFIDLGDQFIALQEGRKQPADDGRHSTTRRRLAGRSTPQESPRLMDPS
jgi:lactoylglutathione lyase